MSQSKLTDKAKSAFSAIGSVASALVGYGLLPEGTPHVVTLVGTAALAAIAAFYAVKHLAQPGV